MLDPRNVSAGEEQFEEYYPSTSSGRGPVGQKRMEFNKRVQYDYRHTNGKLFCTIAVSLEEARERRDKWILRVEGG